MREAEDPEGRYESHDPEHTLLYRVVCDELEPFLARARERPAPHFVEQELRTSGDSKERPVSRPPASLKTRWLDGTYERAARA